MRFLFFIFTWFASHTAFAVTTVTATVDKNPLMVDESLVLTIIANDDVDRNAFDSSVLLQDFIVGRTSVSSQTQMINFNTTRSTQWTTTLIPRREGIITIPAITIDGVQSEPIELRILPISSRNGSSDGRDIYVTTELDKSRVYLQQQITYTVKLHLAVELQRGSLQAPQLAQSDIRQLGEDREYTDIINGKRYRVIERNFAILPQQSGVFDIDGPLFEGEVLANDRRSFGFFNRTRTVNRVGPSQQIEVLPIPADIDGHWLPSEMVQLDEEWPDNSPQFIVGEPVTRTLTLTALGVSEEQLPEMTAEYPDSVKTYPDQANTSTLDRDNMLIAQRVESLALIPSEPGQFTLPEVKVAWFNTLTNRKEFASVPARTITVAPAQNTSPSGLAAPAVSETPTTRAERPAAAAPSQSVTATPAWWSISSWVLLTLWLLTLTLWYFSRRQASPSQPEVKVSADEQEAWSVLMNTLDKTANQSSVSALQNWLGCLLNRRGQSMGNLILDINDEAALAQINLFMATRYAPDKRQLNVATLKGELSRLRLSKKQSEANANRLTPLYPQ